MKKYTLMLFLFLSSSSFADKKLEFLTYLHQSVKEVEKISINLKNHLFFLSLKESENASNRCLQYFGKVDFTEREASDLNELLNFVYVLMERLSSEVRIIESYDLLKKESELISGVIYSFYARELRSIKGLEDWINKLNLKESSLKNELSSILQIFLSMETFLDELRRYLIQFFKVDCLSKKRNEYIVTLDIGSIISQQIRDIKNIYKIISKINLDKFDINKRYKRLLKGFLEQYKEMCLLFMQSKIKIDKEVYYFSKINLASSESSQFLIPEAIEYNYNEISKVYSFVCNPLSQQFVEHGNICLSDKEIQENSPILNEMLYRPEQEIMSKAPAPKLRQKAQKKSKKKRKSKNNTKLQHNCIEEDQDKTSVISFVEELSLLPLKELTNSIVTETAAMVDEDKIDSERSLEELSLTPKEECQNWLSDIMRKTSLKQGELFSIFYKAHQLYQNLEIHSDTFLEQVQQATFELALRLQAYEMTQIQDDKISYICVDKNYEDDCAYLMYTPVCYLNNNIRFGFVRRLIEGLGGTVDIKHAGSRIALELNNQKIVLHIHDSENGILDGGRITSLREFLLKANVFIQQD